MEKKYKNKLIGDELLIMDEIDRICHEEKLNYFLTAGTLLGAVRHGGMIPWDDDMDITMPRKDFDKFVSLSYKKLDTRFFLDYYTTNKKYAKPYAKVRLKNTCFKESVIGKNIAWEIWIDVFPLDNISEDNLIKLSKNKRKIQHCNSILAKKYLLSFDNCRKIRSKVLYIFAKFIPSSLVIKKRNKCMKRYNNDNNTMYINYGSQYSVEKQTHEIGKYFPTKKIKFESRKYEAPNNIDYVLKKIYGNKYMELPPIEKRKSHDPICIKYSDGEYVEFSNKEDLDSNSKRSVS